MARPARRSLASDFLVFGMGSLAAQATSAVTTPLYTRVLGPAEFGLYETVMALLSLGLTALALGLDQGVVAKLADATATVIRGRRVAAALLVPAVAGTAVAVVTAGSTRDGHTALVAVATAALPFLLVAHVGQQALRALDLSRAFLWSVVARSVLATAVTVALLFTVGRSAGVLIAGLGIGAAVAVGISVSSTARQVPLRWDRRAAVDLLRYSVPLVPSALAGWSSMLVDRVILADRRSLTEVGYYSVANRIAGLLLTLTYAFQAAWTARALRAHHGEADRGAATRAEGWLLLGCSVALAGAALSAFAPELVLVAGGREFAGAVPAVPLLTVGFAAYSLVTVAQVPALTAGRTALISLLAMVTAAANLGLNLLLIPPFGVMGAAGATAISFAALAALHAAVGQAIEPTAVPWRRLVGVGAATAPLGLLVLVPPGPLASPSKVAVWVVWTGLLVRVGVLPLAELRRSVRRLAPSSGH